MIFINICGTSKNLTQTGIDWDLKTAMEFDTEQPKQLACKYYTACDSSCTLYGVYLSRTHLNVSLIRQLHKGS